MSVPQDTPIHMADGSTKPIEDVQVGDRVQGYRGVNSVLGIGLPWNREKPIFNINDLFITGDHAFMTDKGWAVVEKDRYVLIGSGRDPGKTLFTDKRGGASNDPLTRLPSELVRPFGPAQRGSLLKITGGHEPLASFAITPTVPDQVTLHYLRCDGSHTVWTNGYLLTAVPDPSDYDYQKMAPR